MLKSSLPVTIRLSPAELAQLDDYRAGLANLPSRHQAICGILQAVLGGEHSSRVPPSAIKLT